MSWRRTGTGYIDENCFDIDTVSRRIVHFTSRPLSLRRTSPVAIELEAGWALKPVWTMRKSEKAWPYWDFNQPVASCYTECAILALQKRDATTTVASSQTYTPNLTFSSVCEAMRQRIDTCLADTLGTATCEHVCALLLEIWVCTGQF